MFIPHKKIVMLGFGIYNTANNESFTAKYDVYIDAQSVRQGRVDFSPDTKQNEIREIVLSSELRVEADSEIEILIMLSKDKDDTAKFVTFKGITKGKSKYINKDANLFKIKDSPMSDNET